MSRIQRPRTHITLAIACINTTRGKPSSCRLIAIWDLCPSGTLRCSRCLLSVMQVTKPFWHAILDHIASSNQKQTNLPSMLSNLTRDPLSPCVWKISQHKMASPDSSQDRSQKTHKNSKNHSSVSSTLQASTSALGKFWQIVGTRTRWTICFSERSFCRCRNYSTLGTPSTLLIKTWFTTYGSDSTDQPSRLIKRKRPKKSRLHTSNLTQKTSRD